MRKLPFSIFLLLFVLLASTQSFAEDKEEDIVYENAYIKLSPDLVSNLQGRKTYIRTSIQLMTNRAELAYHIEEHLPLIRHVFLMTLIDKKASDIKSPKGKEALRKEMLKLASKALDEKIPVKGLLTDVFFTTYHVK
jgi:flagellar basal body-associated protein FliL